MKWIKNNTVGDKTWVGKLLNSGEYYEIQSIEEINWINNPTLLTDIGSGDAIVAKDDSGNTDITNVSDAINYLKDILPEIDSEGRQISRIAAGKKGWTYLAHPIEITTSTVGGCFSSDYSGSPRTDFDMKLYDVNDNEITTQVAADTDCVKTVITFKPNYDYEIISGNIFQTLIPTSDVRLWVIGGAFAVDTNTPISVKSFIGGINMKFVGIDDHVETDGRASKLMVEDITSKGLPHPTYQGNCFQFIIRHNAGVKHNIMSVLEYFRA